MPAKLTRALDKIMPTLWWLALAVFTIVVTALATLAILADRTATLRDSEARVHSLAQIFIEHADRTLAEAQKMILAIQPLVSSWDGKDPVLGRRIFDEMRTLLIGSPELGAAWILDSRGKAILDTWAFPSQEIDASGRLYFKAHLASEPKPVVGGQDAGGVSGKPRFTISRAIHDSQGNIQSVIVVAIYSEYFEALYRSTASWPGATAGLFLSSNKNDLDILARMETADTISQDLRAALPQLLKTAKEGVEILHLASGPRVVGWYSSRAHSGIFSATSQSVLAALREWRWRSMITSGSAGLSILFFALLGVFGSRAERTERALGRQRMLMREVHHRVKNNLSIIAAITNAAARQFKSDTAVQEQFRKLGNQIFAIATLYDLMQRAPGVEVVEINGVLALFAANYPSLPAGRSNT